MRYLFKHKALLIGVLVILLISIMAVISALTGGYASPVTNTMGQVFKPFQTAVIRMADQLLSVYGYMYQYDSLQEENAQLRVRIAEMEEEIRLSESANEENVRLRKLLGLSERVRDFALESATITKRNVTNWSSTFTISRGSLSGIQPHNCVINEEGFLVGVVSEVGANWAEVTTLIDTDMEAGAFNYRTRQEAVAEGNFDLMRRGLLRLSYLKKDDDIKNGDVIMTSGIGGMFPRDLVIGSVQDMRTAETGISAYAIIEPAVNLDRLTQVFIIKSFDISE